MNYFTPVLPVMMYWESPLKAQSHTHLCVFSFSSVISVWSAVRQILQVWSADVVANNLQINQSEMSQIRNQRPWRRSSPFITLGYFCLKCDIFCGMSMHLWCLYMRQHWHIDVDFQSLSLTMNFLDKYRAKMLIQWFIIMWNSIWKENIAYALTCVYL